MTTKQHGDSIRAALGSVATREMRRSAPWAAQLVQARQHASALQTFGAQLAERSEQAEELDALTARLRERYTAEPAEPDQLEMTLAPFSPPLRQISAVRQGAPAWNDSRPASEPQPMYTPVTLEHAVAWLPRAPMEPLLGDALAPGRAVRSMQRAGASIRRARVSPMNTDEQL